MKYYIPVTKRTLPEYLSSGFIGLPASRDPDVDMQSKYYPDLLAFNKTSKPSYQDSVLILIESSVMCENEVDYFRLAGPVAISNIESILFESQADLDDFVSIYQMMPDIPLQLFNFSVDGDEATDYSSSFELIKLPKSRKKNNLPDASSLASFIIGLKASCIDLSSHINNFPSLSFKSIDLAYMSNNIIKSLIESAGYSNRDGDSAIPFMELYIDCVTSFDNKTVIEPKLLITKMSDAAKDRNIKGIYSDAISNRLQSIFDKTDKIMLGYESNPKLLDQHLVLQRAVYLACISKNIDTIKLIKKNTEIGPFVEAIAKLLISLKHRLTSLSEDDWRNDRAIMNGILNTSESILHAKTFDLTLDIGDINADFSFDQFFKINGESFITIKAPPSHYVGQVVSVLRALSYIPKPDVFRNICIMHYPGSGQNPIKIIIQICDDPLEGNIKYIKVGVFLESGIEFLNKKVTRSKLFKICSQFMVAFDDLDGTDIMFYRTQLINTMDREELELHIKLVGKVFLEAKSQLLN